MNALPCFHEAVALEPSFLNPYYNIAYITSNFPHFGMMSIEEARAITREAAEKAMALEPLNARSQLINGIHEMFFEWDMAKAERYIMRSIELNPNLYEAHFLLGWLRMIMQQKDQLQAPLDIAYRLDPIGGETVPGIGEINFFAGHIDVAEHYCDEGIRNNPDSMYAHTMKALVVGGRGDWPGALMMIERWPGLEGIPFSMGSLAMRVPCVVRRRRYTRRLIICWPSGRLKTAHPCPPYWRCCISAWAIRKISTSSLKRLCR
jgi:tetratricopeptide (TPR) repeat protein